jgi:hypothetical protein
MTSAFIVPDITIRGLPTETEAEPILSAAAQHVLDGLTQHDGQNCTVCRRIASHDHGKEKAKESLKVPRPIPVSERMPQAGEWNEEPTVRPAQPPAIALALVMKGLEDELSHLKMYAHLSLFSVLCVLAESLKTCVGNCHSIKTPTTAMTLP